MKAAVIHVDNPFRPDLSRRVLGVSRRRRIRALAPRTRQPFIAILNGRPVLRTEWTRKLRDQDVLMFVRLPAGGGGGSNPLKIVLMLVVAYFAPYAAGALNASLGLGLGATGMSVLTAGIGIVGNMLINTLLPPPRPSTPQIAAGLAAPSPTYSLTAQGNSIRFGAPIPVLYGRHVLFPDFAAQPYTEYAGNEQFLYELLCLGQGYMSVESIRIEDTSVEGSPIADGAIHAATGAYEDIHYQIISPGGSVTLFPANVVTVAEVAGQELPGRASGTYSMSGTTITVTETAHGRSVGQWVRFSPTTGTASQWVLQIATVPGVNSYTLTAPTSLTTSGNCTIETFIGPFVATSAGVFADTLGIDYVMPRGLYYAETDGRLTTKTATAALYARPIDSAGNPTGAWSNVSGLGFSHTAATTTPQRVSMKHNVTAGRYEIMPCRTDAKDTSPQAGHELVWGSSRAYIPGSQSYGNVTLLALRMRASNSLSQLASRKINVLATRKLRTWNGTSWNSPVATRSIAWAIADIAQAVYGGKRPDSRIDLNGLKALDAIWTARGDNLDVIFDSPITVWEALQLAAKPGRASPVEQGGVLRVIRDGAITLPSAMYSSRNIAKGSFSLDYTMPSDETADAIDVEYFDSTVWQPRVVRAYLPGSSQATVAKVQLMGVTNRNHAWREGMYMAAVNRYRRRHVTFSTEMEGFILSPGDLVAIQHDMPRWGQSGEVLSLSGLTVTTSEPLDFSAGGTHVMAFRKRDGSVDGPYTATAGAQPNEAVLDSPPAPVYTGGGAERTHYAFGPVDQQYIRAKVVGVRPRSDVRVEVSVVIESDYVHTAETGVVPGASAWQLPTRITMPALTGLLVRSSPVQPDFLFLSWQASPGADHYLIEVSDSGNGWTRVGETRTTTFTAVAAYGARTFIRVCAVGEVRGPWVTIAYGSSASYMWNAVDTTLMWAADSSTDMWRY